MSSHPMTYYVVTGLQRRLKKVFRLANEPQLRLTNDPYSQLLQTGGGPRTDNAAVQYPITSIRPTSVQQDEESYRAAFTAKKGFATRFGLIGNTQSAASAFNFTPVVIPFEFSYITDDPFRFIEFAAKWAHESNTGRCNYYVTFQGAKFDIRVKLDPQFEVPEKEGGYDSQQQAIATSTITVHAFVPGDVVTIDRKTLAPELVFSDVAILPQKSKVT